MKKRVKLPKDNPKALLNLATKLRAKHMADGESSPLKVLNWTEIDPLINETIAVEAWGVAIETRKVDDLSAA